MNMLLPVFGRLPRVGQTATGDLVNKLPELYLVRRDGVVSFDTSNNTTSSLRTKESSGRYLNGYNIREKNSKNECLQVPKE